MTTDLLSVARGPLLQWSLAIFVFGVFWRITAVMLLKTKPDYSEARTQSNWRGLRLVFTRMWPKAEFMRKQALDLALGYVFHIGFFVVLLFFLPHILLIKDLTGLHWPNLPNGVIFFVGAVTVGALIALLFLRISSPVKRLLSNFDDYFSWLVTTLPLVTGLLAAAHVGARYETLLALHILSVEVFLIWFPFGKLMHAILFAFSRGTSGILFERKGATT